MHVTVDWETQGQEMILVWYQSDDGERDSTGFIVGRPLHDNADDERRALEKAVAAMRAQIGDLPDPAAPLFRLIVSQEPANLRAIWGTPQAPIAVDMPVEISFPVVQPVPSTDLGRVAAAVLSAAHVLIAAKLDPHEDTAA